METKIKQQQTSGTISYHARISRPASPSLTKKRVVLTLTSEDDEQTLANKGLAGLRRERILRLCTEAQQQGVLLGYADLATLLSTSLSTLKRDLRLLRKHGVPVAIRLRRQMPVSRNAMDQDR